MIVILRLTAGRRYRLRDGRVIRVTTVVYPPRWAAYAQFVADGGAAVTEMPVAALLALIVEEMPND